MKRICSALLCALLLAPALFAPHARAVSGTPEVSAKACLLMEKETGTVLWEDNAHARLEPASVTKIMTLLLVLEAVDSGALALDRRVTVSANAASMGGSQVFLKEGEQMSVHELLKCVAVSSANDASVALAEELAGSESAFAARMNERAAQLGMADTSFVNCTGLPAEGHLTSAWDIALMGRELIRAHPSIRGYSTIWMDSIRDGAFGLSNTNKLIRYYEGATGLKTGSTDAARFCVCATAERGGMELLAVVLGSDTSSIRFEGAKSLLSFGFANYALREIAPEAPLPPVPVLLGEADAVQPVMESSARLLIEKAEADAVEICVDLSESVEAPVEAGQKLGELTVTVNGTVRQTVPLTAAAPVGRLGLFGVLERFLRVLLFAG